MTCVRLVGNKTVAATARFVVPHRRDTLPAPSETLFRPNPDMTKVVAEDATTATDSDISGDAGVTLATNVVADVAMLEGRFVAMRMFANNAPEKSGSK